MKFTWWQSALILCGWHQTNLTVPKEKSYIDHYMKERFLSYNGTKYTVEDESIFTMEAPCPPKI